MAEYATAPLGVCNLQLHLQVQWSAGLLNLFLVEFHEMNGIVPAEVQLRNVFHSKADLSF